MNKIMHDFDQAAFEQDVKEAVRVTAELEKHAFCVLRDLDSRGIKSARCVLMQVDDMEVEKRIVPEVADFIRRLVGFQMFTMAPFGKGSVRKHYGI